MLSYQKKSRKPPVTPFAIPERERYCSEAISCRYAIRRDLRIPHATAAPLPYTTEAAENKLRDDPRQSGLIALVFFLGIEYEPRMPSIVVRSYSELRRSLTRMVSWRVKSSGCLAVRLQRSLQFERVTAMSLRCFDV